MAKTIKPKAEEKKEAENTEAVNTEVINHEQQSETIEVTEAVETVTEENVPATTQEYVHVPDIPAQMIDNSVPEQPNGETEVQFLQRILNIQEEGGFGRHLHKLINDRIKSLS